MNKKHLTQEQRYTIFRMLEAGCTRKDVCIAIGKDKSVRSRKLKRNSFRRGYSPHLAQEYADERKERFAKNRTFTEPVKQKIIKELTEEQNKRMILSITSDNGSEFYEHKMIAKMLYTSFYFAHPYSSWERGLNEYTNKLIRQYIPKKAAFTQFSDELIYEIQKKLNRRPRKCIHWNKPENLFCLYFI